MRTIGPGGLIVPGAVVLLDADTAAAVVELVGLDVAHRRLLGRDPIADEALAAIVALARTAERKPSVSGGMCAAGVPTPCRAEGSGAGSTPMVTAAAAELDVSGVASVLGVGIRAVRGLAERRTLPGWKVAGEWRFARVDVERLAARRAQRRGA